MIRNICCFLCALASLFVYGRDFTYNGIIYTIVDENAKTCETKVGSVEYTDEDRIINTYNKLTGQVAFPEYVYDGDEKYKLIGIGKFGFYSNSEITSIQFPLTLEYIGNNAFNSCSNLKEILFYDSITEYGIASFNNCKNLEKITFRHSDNNEAEDRKAYIRQDCFRSCKSLINY